MAAATARGGERDALASEHATERQEGVVSALPLVRPRRDQGSNQALHSVVWQVASRAEWLAVAIVGRWAQRDDRFDCSDWQEGGGPAFLRLGEAIRYPRALLAQRE